MNAAIRVQARRETMALRRRRTVLGGMERSGELAERLAIFDAVNAAWVGDDQAGAVL